MTDQGGLIKRSTQGLEIHNVQKDSTLDQIHFVPQKTAKPSRRQRMQNTLANAQDNYQARSPIEWVETFVPMVKWLRTYNFKANIVADIIAGLTVTAVIIPQSMSFAKLAGLPVQFGLYSSFMPIYAYSVFGTSRQLAIGTSAVSSLTFSSVMNDLNPNSKSVFVFSWLSLFYYLNN